VSLDPILPEKEAGALLAWLGVVLLLLLIGCLSACATSVLHAPSIKAAPSDPRVEDDCLGGACLPPGSHK
jgi:hypothetical protein